MSDLTFPQVGDLPDSAFFSSLIARGRSGIISGLTFSVDFSVPEVTVQPGFAVVATGSETTQHPNITPSETVQETSKVVDLDAQTEPLTNNAVNSIFLDANVGSDDDPQIVPNTTGTPPTAESFKIGEVDTSGNTTAEQFNRLEEDGTLSFPTSAAASDALAGLPSGVAVIDRSQGIRLTTNGSLSVQGNISAKAEPGSQQSIPDATLTDINLGTTVIEQDAAIIEVDTAANEMIIKESGVYSVTGSVQFNDPIEGCEFDFAVEQDSINRLTRSRGLVPGFSNGVEFSDSITTLVQVTSPPTTITFEIFHNFGASRFITPRATALTITKQN
jgi:hypothetical protein